MNRRLLVILTALLSISLILAGHAPRVEAVAGTAQGVMDQKGHAPEAPLAPVGTSFPYSGFLLVSGVPANGSYDFTFTLYDSLSGGVQVGSMLTVLNKAVSDGHYEAALDFGASAFQGQARWLQIAWRPAGSGSYTTLTPRRAIPTVPYAISLMPGTVVTSTSGSVTLGIISARNLGAGTGLFGSSESGRAVYGSTATGTALYGYSNNSGTGVYGTSTSGPGVKGNSDSSIGAIGTSSSGRGVYGSSNGSDGVYGLTNAENREGSSIAGVYGVSTGRDGVGVRGVANNGSDAIAVLGTTIDGIGVLGTSDAKDGIGVRGVANEEDAYGVFGRSSEGAGVRGYAESGDGVHGSSWQGVGVYGESNVSNGVRGDTSESHQAGVDGNAFTYGDGVHAYATYDIGLWAKGGHNGTGYAAFFDGKTHVNGVLSKSGGSFKIDHPLDPENKYLSHSFVESPDMMNVYNGNVTTGANGEAFVQLPSYFETLNKDFRYQLTVMGQFAQAIVSEKVKGNQFTIKTDKPNVEVSWQVTGIRKDPFAEQNRIPVEEDKPQSEQGTYLNPSEYGQPESKGLYYEKSQQNDLQRKPSNP